MKNISKEQLLSFFLLIIGLLPYAWFFSQPEIFPGFDWTYFNAQALLASSYIHAGEIPLFDPWVCGGVDLLANPQTWIFSPLILTSILFSPYTGNLISLIILAVGGFLGMRRLLTGRDPFTRDVMSSLFISSSFFWLHFTEGHLTYRTFYLLPWILVFAQFKTIKHFLGIFLILTFMLIDGGIYPFFFSLMIVFPNTNYRRLMNLLKTRYWEVTAILIASVFISLPKIIPVLSIHKNLFIPFEEIHLSLSDLVPIFFRINQSHLERLGQLPFRFHEYGLYLGISLFSLFCLSLKYLKKEKLLIIQLIFFFWMASGWGGIFNPWTLIKAMPFFKQMHVQSRLFILFYLILLMLISRASNSARIRKFLLSTALLEFVVCGFYVTSQVYKGREFKAYKLPERKNVTTYLPYLPIPDVYAKGALSRGCYEPANPHRLAPSMGVFLYANTPATLTIEGQKLLIRSDQDLPSQLHLNFNWNGGWDCLQCTAFENHGLIVLDIPEGTREIELRYRPAYLPYIFWYYSIGLFVVLFIFWRSRNPNRPS